MPAGRPGAGIHRGSSLKTNTFFYRTTVLGNQWAMGRTVSNDFLFRGEKVICSSAHASPNLRTQTVPAPVPANGTK